jgi:hypothetical protein
MEGKSKRDGQKERAEASDRLAVWKERKLSEEKETEERSEKDDKKKD